MKIYKTKLTIFSKHMKSYDENSQAHRILHENLEYYAIMKAQSFEYLSDCLLSVHPALDGFCERRLEHRINPAQTLPTAKTIICALFPYETALPPAAAPAHIPPENVGYIYSGDVFWGADYHNIVRKKLSKVCEQLTVTFGGVHQGFCDTGPLVDKEVAVAAGLCVYGKNTLTYHPELGFSFYIGYILSTLSFKDAVLPNKKVQLRLPCAHCNLCAAACPGGAITAQGKFEHKKCVSYLTQKKGLLSPEEQKAIGNSIYGCTTCQRVCPANSPASHPRLPVDALHLLQLSNRQLKETLSTTAAGWIGKTTLLRNCLIALHHNRHPKQEEIYSSFVNHPNQVLSHTAIGLKEKREERKDKR